MKIKEKAVENVKKEAVIPVAKKLLLANKTGSWRSGIKPLMNDVAPCGDSCLANEEIREWLEFLRKKDFVSAYLKILERNPFPELMSVCPAPCERACNLGDRYNFFRGAAERPVTINVLETELGKLFADRKLKFPKIRYPQKIAVIGGGPAGMSAAFYLRWLGYRVTLYEKEKKLGGMLRQAIPKNRLNRKLLKKSVWKLRQNGLLAALNAKMDAETLKRLLTENDAVIIACGAHKSKKISCGGNLGSRITPGLDFLKDAARGFAFKWRKRLKNAVVAVIGGGDTSIDVAMEAQRLGASEVIITTVLPEEKLTAQKKEIALAKEKGIKFIHLVHLVSWGRSKSAWGGKGTTRAVFKLLPEKTELSGLKEAAENSKKFLYLPAVKTIFCSIGETPDLSWIPAELKEKAEIAGDAKNGPSLAAMAAREGRLAAWKTHLKWRGEKELPPLEIKRKMPALFKSRLSRKFILSEFVKSGSLAEEAGRCLGCGVCIRCHQCRDFCPDMAVVKLPRETKEMYYGINYDYCKGCGICAELCSRHGSFCISMGEEENGTERKEVA